MATIDTKMAGRSLFAGVAAGGGGGGSSGYVHSFKAGRCEFDPVSKTVTPQPEKGTLFIKVCMRV